MTARWRRSTSFSQRRQRLVPPQAIHTNTPAPAHPPPLLLGFPIPVLAAEGDRSPRNADPHLFLNTQLCFGPGEGGLGKRAQLQLRIIRPFTVRARLFHLSLKMINGRGGVWRRRGGPRVSWPLGNWSLCLALVPGAWTVGRAQSTPRGWEWEGSLWGWPPPSPQLPQHPSQTPGRDLANPDDPSPGRL